MCNFCIVHIYFFYFLFVVKGAWILFIYFFSCRSISKYFRGGETNIYIYIYLFKGNLNFFVYQFFWGMAPLYRSVGPSLVSWEGWIIKLCKESGVRVRPYFPRLSSYSFLHWSNDQFYLATLCSRRHLSAFGPPCMHLVDT